MARRSHEPLDFSSPRRVQIVQSSGGRNPYFKVGQFAYVLSSNDHGGMYFCNTTNERSTRESAPGEVAYLVSKTKDMRGGALWFSKDGIRFTCRRR